MYIPVIPIASSPIPRLPLALIKLFLTFQGAHHVKSWEACCLHIPQLNSIHKLPAHIHGHILNHL